MIIFAFSPLSDALDRGDRETGEESASSRIKM